MDCRDKVLTKKGLYICISDWTYDEEMGTVQTQSAEMRYRLDIACRYRVLADMGYSYWKLFGYELQRLGSCWTLIVERGMIYTITIEMRYIHWTRDVEMGYCQNV